MIVPDPCNRKGINLKNTLRFCYFVLPRLSKCSLTQIILKGD